VKNEPILIIFGIWNPDKFPHQKITNLSISPVKCKRCTLKNSKSFSECHLKHSQLQLDKLSQHEITFISFTDETLFSVALLRTHKMIWYTGQW